MISPDYWLDEEIGIWSSEAKLAYIGLWNFADDEGIFRANPKLLKTQIFPYNDNIDMQKLLDEMKSKIQLYEVDGQKYGHIKNFLKHQYIQKPQQSRFPKPPALIKEPVKEVKEPIVEPVKELVKEKKEKHEPSKFHAIMETITEEEKDKGNKIWSAINKCVKMKIEFNERSKKIVILWIRSFPSANIPEQIKLADNWMVANNKEYTNGIKFFNGWISRSKTNP